MIDEMNKAGPPMMQEIQLNQSRVIDQTRQANKAQGEQNLVLLVKQRRQNKQQKIDDLAEYNAKYQVDLMARLS